MVESKSTPLNMKMARTVCTFCSWKYGDKAMETIELCIVQTYGAATVIISLLSVVYPRLPSSTCLLSEEYIVRSGPIYIDFTDCWVPTSFKTVSLSLSPLLPHPSFLFALTLFFYFHLMSLCVYWQWQTDREREGAKESVKANWALIDLQIAITYVEVLKGAWRVCSVWQTIQNLKLFNLQWWQMLGIFAW